MSEHDAGYFRRHDRIKDQRRSIELHSPMQLPWPRNLFGDMASVEELLAEHFGENPGEICRCGCDPVPRIVDARYAHTRHGPNKSGHDSTEIVVRALTIVGARAKVQYVTDITGLLANITRRAERHLQPRGKEVKP
jgi:hypothetical protein